MADDVVVQLFDHEAANEVSTLSGEREGELVRDAQNGNGQAFAALVRRYQNVVHAVAYALTGRISTAVTIPISKFVTVVSSTTRIPLEDYAEVNSMEIIQVGAGHSSFHIANLEFGDQQPYDAGGAP